MSQSTRRAFLRSTALAAAGALWARSPLRAEDRLPAPSTPLRDIEPGTAGTLPAPDSRFVREAYFYQRLEEGRIRCQTCPHHCVLEIGETGFCRAKANLDGRHFSLSYGNPCSIHVDPIEKKPLLHFLPGSKAFSLAVAGCNLRCLNCQNWEISQVSPLTTRNYDLRPEEVVQAARRYDSRSIAYTYSEPTSFYEYGLDIAMRAREAGVRNVWVSNAYIEKAPLDRLAPFLDGAAMNLKSFEDRTYQELIAGHLQPVMDTLVRLKEHGVWLEVINLVVPTWTDDLEVIRRMCAWFLQALGPDTPLHFSRFSPLYKLAHLPPTPVETLVQAREVARSEGLRFVYIGNVPEIGEDTVCPDCGKLVIGRRGFRIREMHLKDGACEWCGGAIPGRWT